MTTVKARKLATLHEVARGQHGVVTRAQATAAGFSVSAIARAVDRGEWQRLHPGIFQVDPAVHAVTAAVMGAVLRAPGEAWASHRTAAHLWGMSTVTPLRPEISTTANLRGGRAVVHRLASMPDQDRCIRIGIPITSVERTLVDLAGVVGRSALEEIVVGALRARLTTVAELRRRGDELAAPGRRGSGTITRVLERWGDGAAPESVLEARMIGLLRRAGLPEPARQWPVTDGGRFVARLDFAYPRWMIAIETDGYRWHARPERWQRDLARRNALTRLGWMVLHFTWEDVQRKPREVAATIRSALSGRDVPQSGTKRPGSGVT